MMRPANGRAHLSIGEVLSLLQDEFPDVTISKIRFLESQGLLDPERTPSGYRKFYNSDIERLRWILRQQKEHYLPLRVIKDKLDQAGGEIPPDDPVEEPATTAPTQGSDGQQKLLTGDESGRTRVQPGPDAPHPPASARNGANPSANSNAAAAGDAHPPERWMDSSWPEEPPLDMDGLSRPQVLPAPPPRPEPPLSGSQRRQRQAHPPGAMDGEPVVEAGPSRGGPAAGSEPGAGRNRDARSVAPDGSNRASAGRAARQPRSRAQGRRSPTNAAGRPARGAAVEPPPTGDSRVTDVILTADELAEASGLSVRDIRDLEKFGLIDRASGEDGQVFDGDALVIAHTAAGFLQHGIEARHMRTYKVAIEREAGLFEQIVLPVLKQRNPEARQRATRTITELIRLGEVMRSALLRRELRDHLGGG